MQDDPTHPPGLAIVPLADVLLPGTECVTLPNDTKAKIRDAVEGVARKKRRTPRPADVSAFIDSIEGSLTLHLMVRGRWTRGPHGVMRLPAARDSKPRPSRTDYMEPLSAIEKALKKIDAALTQLPTDGIRAIEDGADEWLWRRAGIEDEYPEPFTIDVPPEKLPGAITDDAPLERYKFLLRLEALRHGVQYAKDRATDKTAAHREKDYDTPRLIRDIADAYAHHLGRVPTPNGRTLNTPILHVCCAVFDWLGTIPGEKSLADKTINNYLIDNGPKRR